MRIALATTVQPGLDHIGPLERHQTDITVLRRAEDLAELLAIARSGLVDAVLVAGDTESLTAAFLEETARLPRPVGVAALSEVRAERRRLRSMGVPCVRADADPEQIAAVVVESASAAAEGRRPETSHGEDADHARDHAEDLDDLPITLETLGADEVPGLTDPWRDADEPDDAGPGAAPAAATPDDGPATAGEGADPAPSPEEGEPTAPARESLVTVVWGPTGAPGRTTVAVNLAAEHAVAGRNTLLVDLDTYGPAVGVHLGLTEESAGVARAVRRADHGRLGAADLADGFVAPVTDLGLIGVQQLGGVPGRLEHGHEPRAALGVHGPAGHGVAGTQPVVLDELVGDVDVLGAGQVPGGAQVGVLVVGDVQDAGDRQEDLVLARLVAVAAPAVVVTVLAAGVTVVTVEAVASAPAAVVAVETVAVASVALVARRLLHQELVAGQRLGGQGGGDVVHRDVVGRGVLAHHGLEDLQVGGLERLGDGVHEVRLARLVDLVDRRQVALPRHIDRHDIPLPSARPARSRRRDSMIASATRSPSSRASVSRPQANPSSGSAAARCVRAAPTWSISTPGRSRASSISRPTISMPRR